MRRRHLYVLMFSVPGLFASLRASFALFGAAAGHVLMVLFAVTAVGSWLLLMRLAFAAAGERRRANR